MLTCVMMVAEIVGGTCYGSMAVVADGWHMATHAAALGVAMLAYRYARAHADNPRFAFGTGKVGDLAGFASAVSLVIVALLIGAGSVQRLLNPVKIDFLQAGGIAVVGPAGEPGQRLDAARTTMDHDHDHDHDDDDDMTTSTTTRMSTGHPRHQPACGLPACAGRRADLGAGHRRPAGRALPRLDLDGRRRRRPGRHRDRPLVDWPRAFGGPHPAGLTRRQRAGKDRA